MWCSVLSILAQHNPSFQFKPILLSLGIDVLLPKVSNPEMEALDSVLKTPGDKREGQVLANYDRVYQHIRDKAMEYDIPLPPLFEKDSIDRTALTYFNTNKEVGHLFLLCLTSKSMRLKN